MPFLSQLLDGPLVIDRHICQNQLLLKGIDACLGVPGLPQSATGQTALYTGCNAAKFRGCHQTGFANGSLRQLIEAHGLFRQVKRQGGRATYANLFSPAYFEAIAQRRWRYSVGTLLTLTAGLPFRMQYEYEKGTAIYWDITGDLAHHRGVRAAPITAWEAGRRLAFLGTQHHVTLFECYLPDFAGHAQDWDQALAVLARIDEFLASVVEHLPANASLLICSDHGNVEDLSTSRHTLNPVPLLVIGPLAPAFRHATAITDLTPTILQSLAFAA